MTSDYYSQDGGLVCCLYVRARGALSFSCNRLRYIRRMWHKTRVGPMVAAEKRLTVSIPDISSRMYKMLGNR